MSGQFLGKGVGRFAWLRGAEARAVLSSEHVASTDDSCGDHCTLVMGPLWYANLAT